MEIPLHGLPLKTPNNQTIEAILATNRAIKVLFFYCVVLGFAPRRSFLRPSLLLCFFDGLAAAPRIIVLYGL